MKPRSAGWFYVEAVENPLQPAKSLLNDATCITPFVISLPEFLRRRIAGADFCLRSAAARCAAGCPAAGDQGLRPPAHYPAAITVCCCSPRPSTPSLTRSPTCRKRPRPMPTPCGVPVQITSPGSRVMKRET